MCCNYTLEEFFLHTALSHYLSYLALYYTQKVAALSLLLSLLGDQKRIHSKCCRARETEGDQIKTKACSSSSSPHRAEYSKWVREQKPCLLVFMVLTYLAPAPVRRKDGCGPGALGPAVGAGPVESVSCC